MILKLIFKKIAAALPVLLLLFVCTRGLIRLLPGDPIETLIAESGSSLPIEFLRAELGLDRPFLLALGQDLLRWLGGDLGRSILSGQPVGPLLLSRLQSTFILASCAWLSSLIFSLSLGCWSAVHPQGKVDRAGWAFTTLSAALPLPWLGPLLLIIFSLWIPISPVSGGLALPTFTLALSISGVWSRLVRNRTAEQLTHPSVSSARARGVSELRVALKYGLAPAAGGLMAYFTSQLGHLLAGSFVAELIFGWKGMGTLLIEAVLKRDYPVVEAGIFLSSALIWLANTLGDILQRIVDPRQREAL